MGYRNRVLDAIAQAEKHLALAKEIALQGTGPRGPYTTGEIITHLSNAISEASAAVGILGEEAL